MLLVINMNTIKLRKRNEKSLCFKTIIIILRDIRFCTIFQDYISMSLTSPHQKPAHVDNDRKTNKSNTLPDLSLSLPATSILQSHYFALRVFFLFQHRLAYLHVALQRRQRVEFFYGTLNGFIRDGRNLLQKRQKHSHSFLFSW
jgi:hypothetical protein